MKAGWPPPPRPGGRNPPHASTKAHWAARSGTASQAPTLALTSAPALPRGQDHSDEQQDEEQQSGQHVAQLLEEVGPALGDDDVDDAAAARQRGVCGGPCGGGVSQRVAWPSKASPAALRGAGRARRPPDAQVPYVGQGGAGLVPALNVPGRPGRPSAPGAGALLWLEPLLPGESLGGGSGAGSVTFRWKTRRSCRPQ